MPSIKKFSTLLVLIIALYLLLKRKDLVRDSFYLVIGLTVAIKDEIQKTYHTLVDEDVKHY